MENSIAIIGCGYVGLTTAAILAHAGFKVSAIEINPERLKVIQSGKSFFYEAGIDALLAQAINDGNLRVTNSYAEAIPQSKLVFSCVGTPDNPDGSSNLSYVFSAAEEVARYIDDSVIFIQKSTVPVGTGAKIEIAFAESGKNISYVSNPEFLREGTAVSDTLWPDRVVVGSQSAAAAEQVLDVYRAVESYSEQIAETAELAAREVPLSPRYITMSLASAELTKVTANAFLALKISFANSIAQLADRAGADVVEVMDAVGADPRIGRAFLNAGRGYGGGCFPKDVSGLILSARDQQVDLKIMKAASEVNESMPGYIVNKVRKVYDQPLDQASVAVLGLAFKAGTSDTRRSPAVAIANMLAEQGAQVQVYDPEAMDEARHDLNENVIYSDSFQSAIKDRQIIIVATDWPEFIDEAALEAYKQSGATVLVDCMNRFNPASFTDNSLRYVALGRS